MRKKLEKKMSLVRVGQSSSWNSVYMYSPLTKRSSYLYRDIVATIIIIIIIINIIIIIKIKINIIFITII